MVTGSTSEVTAEFVAFLADSLTVHAEEYKDATTIGAASLVESNLRKAMQQQEGKRTRT